MNNSLQQRLSIWFGIVIASTGILAAGVSFLLAREDGKDLQDNMLKQVAILVARNPGITTETEVPQTSKEKRVVSGAETKITVLRIPHDPRPDWVPENLKPGLHTLSTNQGRIRAFLFNEATGITTIVAQPTSIRDKIALSNALIELILLLVLLPLMAWLTLRVIRRQFAPVNQLANHLDAQSADRHLFIEDKEVPNEIIPFVQAINRLLKRVDGLLREQRRFITDAAHELRSPLTALSIQAQNLQHAESLESMRDRALPLHAGIERARKLTEQLLNHAKTYTEISGTVDINVSDLVRELIAESLAASDERSIDLGLEELASFKWHTDAETLRLILRNALENALKYTPEGGEVTIRLYSGETSEVIEIVDNGPGIPETERMRVFDPFYRIPGTTGEGCGLGLSIAKEASIRLGGQLTLNNRPESEGSGLIFQYRQIQKP